ncbi:ACP S-malonyltransferase [Flexivirga meconopsidis]|uniref:ACP S-malonyltransferase n=1 Tax=Flexivirga meconopsidis TaxID=2977121 RepID=UPI00223FE7DE
MNAPSTVVVAPGQGAQTPRMLASWVRDPQLRELVERWSQIADLDLLDLGTKAPADRIVRTDVAQPLLVAAGLLALQVAPAATLAGDGPIVTAGHSVGELVASVAAGCLQPDQAIRLAAVRGREMARACELRPTGMTGLLGGDPDVVAALVTDCGLQVANRNSAGQVVAAGSVERLATLAERAPEGVRVRPLSVAGAFHTDAMLPAQPAFAAAVGQEHFAEPAATWLSNRDGQPLESGVAAADSLVHQLVSPVRWDLVMDSISRLGPRTFVELPPAGTLTGMAKRVLAGVTMRPVSTPATLQRMSRVA